MIIRQYISDITNQIKQYSMDSYISPKFIYSETINIISDFLKKDHEAKRKLQKLSTGWSEIKCLNLEEVDVVECAELDIRMCEKLMRSKNRLPDTFSYSFGNIIKHVASINFSSFYDPVTPRQWNAIQKREFRDPNKYYYFFIDGYIYIPVPKKQVINVEALRVDAYFISKYEVDVFNLTNSECIDCQNNKCLSPLDYELVCPGYLLNDVKKELLNRLGSLFLKVQLDAYPNMNPNEHNSQRDIQNTK
jgi:hypothetical protein